MTRTKLLLGDVAAKLSDDGGEISHDRTGIQLSLYADSAEMSVPYGETGEGATAVLRTMFLLGQVVEEETGLGGRRPAARQADPRGGRQPRPGRGVVRNGRPAC